MSNGFNLDEVKAKVNLTAILPILKPLEKLDKQYGGKGSGSARGTVEMCVAGRPDLAATINFKGDGVEVVPDKIKKPTLTLEFASPKDLVASFEGGNVRPKIKGILFGFPLLWKFLKLSKLLGKSLMSTHAPGGVKSRGALLMNVVVHAIETLALIHPDVKTAAAGMQGTVQFGIEPEGPFYHITIENGKVATYEGKHSNPTASITLMDSETAVGVFGGTMNPMAAIQSQKMKMTGDPGFALRIGGMMSKVGEVLKPA